jgi:hypothetical protein
MDFSLSVDSCVENVMVGQMDTMLKLRISLWVGIAIIVVYSAYIIIIGENIG